MQEMQRLKKRVVISKKNDKKRLINSRKNSRNLRPKSWKPGQSGNPKGRPPKKECLTSLLKEALENQCPTDKKKRTWAEVLTDQLLIKAAKGDMVAQRLVWEYVEGKPKQEIEIPSDITFHVRYADELKK